MNADQLNQAEKQVYYSAFFKQRQVIDECRESLIEINPEWGNLDSQGLIKALDQIFEGKSEKDCAEKAVLEHRSEQLAKKLQKQFDEEL